MNYTIRSMEVADIKACRKIVEDNWDAEIADQAADEMSEMFDSFTRWPPRYFIAENEQNEVVAFAGYKAAWLMSNTYELIWVNVRKDVQGAGLGKVLTERRLAEIAAKGGSAVLMMTQKPEYFKQFDFEPIHEYYGPKGSWTLMTKQLHPLVLGGRE